LIGVALEKDGKSGSIDVVEFDLTTILQTSMAFGYFHAQGQVNATGVGGATGSASAFAFLLRMFTIFEYDDNNGVPGYQFNSSDSINGKYDLSNAALEWKGLVANHTTVTDSNGNVFKVWFITAQTVDEVFLFRFTVAGTPLSVGGVHITPDSVKVDFQINWFTDKHVPALWTPGPSNPTLHPNAQVGIACGMAAFAESADAETDGTATTDPVISFGAVGFKGYFNWSPSADVVVQGAEAARAVRAQATETTDPNVIAAFKAGWIIRALWFSFDGSRPSSVAWDPQMGSNITYDAASTASSTSSSVNVFVIAIIALLLLFSY